MVDREARTRDLPIRLLGIAIAKLRLDAGHLHEALDEYRKVLAVDASRAESAAAAAGEEGQEETGASRGSP